MEVMVHGDPERLYDAHAPRLYAYCWSLVGDEAPEALKDTFIAAARLGPARGDEVLWLYSLARASCLRRGARSRMHSDARDPDPLRQAAACLRADHREVLLLSAGVWLETRAIARLLGVAPDTVQQLIQAARSRLEKTVLDALLHPATTDRSDDIIAAFEQGRLPALLARRVPTEPPAALRADVLTAVTRALPAETGPLQVTAPGSSPLVAVDPRSGRVDSPARRRVKAGTEIGAIAAAAATAAGLFMAWGTGDRSGGGGLTAPLPHVGGGNGGNPQAPPGAPGGPGAVPAAPSSTPFASEITGVPSTAQPDGPGSPVTGGPTAPAPSGSVPQPSGTSPTRPDDSGTATSPPTDSPSSPTPSQPGGGVGDIGDTVGDTVGGVVDGVGDLIGGELGGTVGGVGDTVGGTVKGTTNTVGDTVGTVEKTATSTLGTVGHLTTNTLGTVTGAAANTLGGPAGSTVGSVGETATNTVGTVTDTATSSLGTVGETTKSTLGTVSDTTASTLGAAGGTTTGDTTQSTTSNTAGTTGGTATQATDTATSTVTAVGGTVSNTVGSLLP